LAFSRTGYFSASAGIMAKRKQLSSDVKTRIIEKYNSNCSIRNISEQLSVPRSTVHDIVSKFKKYGSTTNRLRTGRPAKIDAKTSRKVVRQVLANPRTTRKNIKDQLSDLGVTVSLSTVSNVLHRADLRGRRPRKTPLLKPIHLKTRLKFARDHVEKPLSYWSNVLWTDETKIELFGLNETKHVFRKKGERNNPKNTVPTVKHGGGSIMLWGSFSAYGVGTLYRVNGIMMKEDYLQILQSYLNKDARQLGLGRRWIFQHDRDPKHTAKIVTKWLQESKINVLEWPSQSPDLNPIENLWCYFKIQVGQRRPKNLAELEAVCQEEWAKITPDYCYNLVKNYNKRLQQVIDFKGHTIDY
jgi:transposase